MKPLYKHIATNAIKTLDEWREGSFRKDNPTMKGFDFETWSRIFLIEVQKSVFGKYVPKIRRQYK